MMKGCFKLGLNFSFDQVTKIVQASGFVDENGVEAEWSFAEFVEALIRISLVRLEKAGGNSSGDNGTLATNEVVKRLNEENEAMKIKVKEMEEEFNKIKEDNARMKEDNVRISEELGAIKELLGGGNAIDKKTSSSSSSFTGASH